MAEAETGAGPIRFGPFELDRSGELRKQGARIRLRGQPLQVLRVLLAHAGEVVTRDALRHELWAEGIFVDFDSSISAAVRRLRTALDDEAAVPRFIETLPGQGYRFIEPVQTAPPGTPVAETLARSRRPSRAAIALSALAVATALAGLAGLGSHSPGNIGANLSPPERARPAGRHEVDPQALTAYLKGRYFWNQRGRSPDALKNAVQFFNEAVARDPTYAAPHAGLADAYGLRPRYGQREAFQRLLQGKQHALRALELQPSLVEARTALAKLQYVIDWDWKGAEESFQRALGEDASYVTAHHWYSIYLLIVGRLDQAEAEARRAAALDPASVVASGHAAWVLFLVGRGEEAQARASATLQMAPEHAPMYSLQGRIALQQSRRSDAVAAFTRAYELSGQDPRELATLAHAHAALGREAEARRILAELQRRRDREFVPPEAFVLANASVKRNDAAFTWLDRSMEDRSLAFYLVDLRLDPLFEGLRGDPRLADMFRKLGLDPPRPS